MATGFRALSQRPREATLRLAVLVIGSLLFVPISASADFEAGSRAFETKDYSTAFSQWKTAADQGNTKSQYRLGKLYEEGRGIPQNYVQAHLYYNLAAAQGSDEARSARNAVAGKMVKEELAQARKLAAAWKPARKAASAAPSQATRRAPPSPPKKSAKPLSLLAAADRGNIEAVRSALARGENVDAADRDGWTALLFAAVSGHVGVVEHLIQAGATVDARAKDGATPLMGAALTGRDEVVKVLLAAGADPKLANAAGATALAMARAKRHKNVVAVLGRVTRPSKAQIAEAQRQLQRLGYDPGPVDGVSGKRTATAIAAFQKSIGVSADGRVTAALMAKLKAVKPIKRPKPKADPGKFFAAAEKGDIAAVKQQLKGGIDVNAADKDGWTALMFAAAQGRTKVLSLLLQSKADINKQNRDGNTALMMAVISRKLDAVKVLTAGKPDYELRNKDGASALFIAAERRSKFYNRKGDKTKKEKKLNSIDWDISKHLEGKGAFTNIQIMQVQSLLQNTDYAKDPIKDENGFVGDRTLAAVKQYQAKNGLKIDGKVTAKLVSALEKEFKALGEAMFSRVRRARGFLSGHHGVYRPSGSCGPPPKDAMNKPIYEMGRKVIWSEGNKLYIDWFTRNDPGSPAVLIRHMFNGTTTFKHTSYDKEKYKRDEKLRKEKRKKTGKYQPFVSPYDDKYKIYKTTKYNISKYLMLDSDKNSTEFEMIIGDGIFQLGKYGARFLCKRLS